MTEGSFAFKRRLAIVQTRARLKNVEGSAFHLNRRNESTAAKGNVCAIERKGQQIQNEAV